MNGGPCACGAGDAAGDRNSAFRLPDLALCGATACSGAVAGRESALIGRSPCDLPLAACRRCREQMRQRQSLRCKRNIDVILSYPLCIRHSTITAQTFAPLRKLSFSLYRYGAAPGQHLSAEQSGPGLHWRL